MDIFEARRAAPMLIGRIDQPFDNDEYIFEPKLDGERCLAYLDDNGTDLLSRRGNRLLPKLPELQGLHQSVRARCILDGELVVAPEGKPDFELIKNRVQTRERLRIEMASKRWPASFMAFDILYCDGEQLTGLPWQERRPILEATAVEGGRLSITRYVEGEGCALFEQASLHGLEGVVAKRRDSLYHMGKRTRNWAKIKNVRDDEYIICGYIQQAEYVVSLILGQHDAAGHMVYKGRTTLGRKTQDFAQITAVPKTGISPFAQELPRDTADAVWIQPVLVCTVQYTLLNESGRMRHPQYKGLRPDKLPGEVAEQTRA